MAIFKALTLDAISQVDIAASLTAYKKINVALEQFNKNHPRCLKQGEICPVKISDYRNLKTNNNTVWPDNHKSVVYVFANQEDVVYIGASKNIGARLKSYYKDEKQGTSTLLIDKSLEGADHLFTIKFPKDIFFEIYALEAFLIDRLSKNNQSLLNIQHRKQDQKD